MKVEFKLKDYANADACAQAMLERANDDARVHFADYQVLEVCCKLYAWASTPRTKLVEIVRLHANYRDNDEARALLAKAITRLIRAGYLRRGRDRANVELNY